MLNKNPYDQAHELARALRESELYQRYIIVQKQLALNPEAQERVRQFRVRQLEVNQAQLLGKEVPTDRAGQLALEYAKLNQDKNIAEFLKAEGTFMQLFADIQQIIQKSLESGLTE